MQIYHYNPITGELTSQSFARPDPLEPDKWLLPRHATTIAPPIAPLERVAVFRDGAWSIRFDYRSTPAWLKSTAEPVQVTEIGPLPEGVTLLEPPELFPVWGGATWVSDVVKVVRVKGEQLQAEFARRMQAPLLYDGNIFLVDDWSIQTIKTTLDTCMYLGLTGADPVPTRHPLQPGYWLAADVEGGRIPVPMTVARLQGLHVAGWERNTDLWGALIVHEATIEAMVAEGATAEQIMAYDHTSNW